MFKKLFASCTSACFEFENDTPYRYPAGKYTIFLNGVKVGEGDTNVFSIYGLQPSADYSVTVSCDECSVRFKTEGQTALINVRELGAKGDGKQFFTRKIYKKSNSAIFHGAARRICDNLI